MFLLAFLDIPLVSLSNFLSLCCRRILKGFNLVFLALDGIDVLQLFGISLVLGIFYCCCLLQKKKKNYMIEFEILPLNFSCCSRNPILSCSREIIIFVL